MSKPVLAIQLEWGFHEIKKYIHSGFARKLAEEFEIVWFAIDKGNMEFHRYFHETGFPIVYYTQEEISKPLSSLERYNHAIRQAWMKRRNLGVFHNYKTITGSGWKDQCLGSSWLQNVMARFTMKEIETRYIHSKIRNDFKYYHISKVLSTGVESAFAKAFFTSANQLGLSCFYLVNSWKDLYMNDFIPFSFLKKIMVWDEGMKNKYLHHMSYLEHSTMTVIGNPTFDVLMQWKPEHDRLYYATKYNLSPQSNWLLYTMMPPGIVNDEIATIRTVGKALSNQYKKEELEILVRKNPNHSHDEFLNEELPVNTHVADHYCTYDAKADMIVQSAEGEREWMDLLYHCYANLSVPSTVTMEFLTLSKPVINIELNKNGLPDERLTQHFNAGFYRDLFKRDDVFRVKTMDELFLALNLVLNRKNPSLPALWPASHRIVAALI